MFFRLILKVVKSSKFEYTLYGYQLSSFNEIYYSKPSLEVGSKLYGAFIYIFCFCVLQ